MAHPRFLRAFTSECRGVNAVEAVRSRSQALSWVNYGVGWRKDLPSIFERGLYRSVGKRLLDVFFSSCGLVLVSPLLAMAAAAVWLDSPGPVLFRQQRVGRGGRHFVMLKFRTMLHRPSEPGLRITASGDARITRVGRWLRRTKIDELPQLFNVLRGQMSLVGPRPEVPEYVALYDARQARILELKPGITGPASLKYINEERLLAGRSDRSAFYVSVLLPQKVALDLSYHQSISLFTDVRIVLATLARMVGVRGVSSPSHEVPSSEASFHP